jgi:hypothetical protein
MSNIDTNTGGLLEVLSLLSKPIAVLSDRTSRNDGSRLDRNLQHLNMMKEQRV